MDSTRTLLLIFLLVWSAQLIAGWRQWRHVQQAMDGARGRHADGYLGLGQARSRWRIGRVVLLVVDPALRVRELHAMRGISVLARLRRLPGHEGQALDALQASLRQPGNDAALAAAVDTAVLQIGQARERQLSQVAAAPSPPPPPSTSAAIPT